MSARTAAPSTGILDTTNGRMPYVSQPLGLGNR